MAADPRPIRGENELQEFSGGGNWSLQRCIMSGVMPRRRKINTRPGRVAARERVRKLVNEHDDQMVMLIWGGRILGWSLRKIAAALEGSIFPPGRGLDGGHGLADLPPPRHSHQWPGRTASLVPVLCAAVSSYEDPSFKGLVD